MEEWLLATEKVCAALDLPAVPDHTTLQRTFQKLRQRELDQLKERLLRECEGTESAIAVAEALIRQKAIDAFAGEPDRGLRLCCAARDVRDDGRFGADKSS